MGLQTRGDKEDRRFEQGLVEGLGAKLFQSIRRWSLVGRSLERRGKYAGKKEAAKSIKRGGAQRIRR